VRYAPIRRAAGAVLCIALAACANQPLAVEPVFVEGRAVSAAGDSLLALTVSGRRGILVRRRSGRPQELGAAVLHSPRQVQWWNGEWYASDVENGRPSVVVLTPDGKLKRRIALDRVSDTPHQFAVLADGRLVVEGPAGTLLAMDGDTATTFAVTRQAAKTGLLVAAAGGVLHAIPGRYLTLYNQFGHIRWRLDWPWAGTAFVTDLAVDAHGRIHAIAGVPRDSSFLVYTLSSQTGEVVRWSNPERRATFSVDRLGNIRPDDPDRWTK